MEICHNHQAHQLLGHIEFAPSPAIPFCPQHSEGLSFPKNIPNQKFRNILKNSGFDEYEYSLSETIKLLEEILDELRRSNNASSFDTSNVKLTGSALLRSPG